MEKLPRPFESEPSDTGTSGKGTNDDKSAGLPHEKFTAYIQSLPEAKPGHFNTHALEQALHSNSQLSFNQQRETYIVLAYKLGVEKVSILSYKENEPLEETVLQRYIEAIEHEDQPVESAIIAKETMMPDDVTAWEQIREARNNISNRPKRPVKLPYETILRLVGNKDGAIISELPGQPEPEDLYLRMATELGNAGIELSTPDQFTEKFITNKYMTWKAKEELEKLGLTIQDDTDVLKKYTQIADMDAETFAYAMYENRVLSPDDLYSPEVKDLVEWMIGSKSTSIPALDSQRKMFREKVREEMAKLDPSNDYKSNDELERLFTAKFRSPGQVTKEPEIPSPAATIQPPISPKNALQRFYQKMYDKKAATPPAEMNKVEPVPPLPPQPPIKETPSVKTAENTVDTERKKRQQDLINEAIREGRSEVYTRTKIGFTGILEDKDPRRNTPEETQATIDIINYRDLIANYLGNDLGGSQTFSEALAKKGIYETVLLLPLNKGLVQLVYCVSTESIGTGNPSMYYASNGRPGNMLIVNRIMTKELGEKHIQEIQGKDPTFIRKEVGQTIEKLYPADFKTDTWEGKGQGWTSNQSARPPYEAWSTARMFVGDMVNHSEDKGISFEEIDKRAINFRVQKTGNDYYGEILK